MSIKRDADAAKEIPIAINAAPVIDRMSVFRRLFLNTGSCLLRYSLIAAFISFRIDVINSLIDIEI